MGYIADIYPPERTTPMLTDKYHQTTGFAYFQEGRADNPAVFYGFGRKEAQNGGYTVAAGLEGLIDILKRWAASGLSAAELKYLRDNEKYPPEYLDYLATAPFKFQLDAIPEGTLFFPQEPAYRLKCSIGWGKAFESLALGIVNGQSGYATEGARTAYVLQMDVPSGAPKGYASVQNLRRGPSLGAAFESSRGLVLGGYTSTSTGAAAMTQGVKFAGTMDHAWVQSHEKQLAGIPLSELFKMRDEGRTEELQEALSKDAFRSYAFSFPDEGIFLTDTYDTLEGIEDAITVIKELRALGRGKDYGMRFDSGDLTAFSKIALRRVAERSENGDLLEALPAGADVSKLTHKDLLGLSEKSENSPFCAASDGINVFEALRMRLAGAWVKFWGIGTAASHVPPVGLVQKLCALYTKVLNGAPLPKDAKLTPTMKIVAGYPAKSSNPGVNINSRRFYDENDMLSHIVIYDEDLGFSPKDEIVDLHDFKKKITNPGGSHHDILVPVFDENYNYVYNEPAKKPAYPGSTQMVTDLQKIAAFVMKQIHQLPEAVRRIVRPRDELLKEKLLTAFKQAKKEDKPLTVDMAELEASLPPEVGHIPVYIDALLYEQRLLCEQKHHKTATTGVETYTERFEHT